MSEQQVAAERRARRAAVRVIVADDEESMRYSVSRTLVRHGLDAVAVDSGERTLAEFDARPADVAVIDLMMPGIDGIGVLAELRRRDPEVIVILMTGFGTVSSAVEAMKAGAHDYITKPFESEELLLAVDRALEHRAMVRENRDLRRIVEHRSSLAGLVGQSPPMQSVYQAIERVSDSDATVLVTGESGTGKELVARAIHMASRRRHGPFVPVPCGALMEGLADSELFGHMAGAFTGAKQSRRGLLVRAEGGTLFLDDVGEAGTVVQSKLERFLQEREVVPLGSSGAVRVDVRVIATANRDLQSLVDAGTFRRELLFRLDVVPIRLPPLRERREDIPVLVNHLLAHHAERLGGGPKELTLEAIMALSACDWPGNVRQLANVVERLVAMNPGRGVLVAEDLPDELRPAAARGVAGCSVDSAMAGPMEHQTAMALAERAYFEDLLRRTRGNVRQAARLAGLSRGHVHRKVARLGLDPRGFREAGRG